MPPLAPERKQVQGSGCWGQRPGVRTPGFIMLPLHGWKESKQAQNAYRANSWGSHPGFMMPPLARNSSLT